jgi:Family of unknown function (DUF6529)
LAEFSARPTRRSQGRKVQRLRIRLPSAPLHALFDGRSGNGRLSGPGGAAITATISGAAVVGTVTALSLTWRDSMPRWAVPLLGGTVFLGLIGVWLTSSLWLCTSKGWHF